MGMIQNFERGFYSTMPNFLQLKIREQSRSSLPKLRHFFPSKLLFCLFSLQSVKVRIHKIFEWINARQSDITKLHNRSRGVTGWTTYSVSILQHQLEVQVKPPSASIHPAWYTWRWYWSVALSITLTVFQTMTRSPVSCPRSVYVCVFLCYLVILHMWPGGIEA